MRHEGRLEGRPQGGRGLFGDRDNFLGFEGLSARDALRLAVPTALLVLAGFAATELFCWVVFMWRFA